MGTSNEERRKLFRVEVAVPVRFRMIEEKTSKPLSDWINGSTADVSQGGLKIIASMTDPQAETLVDRYVLIEFSCQLPGSQKAVSGTASIAYYVHDAAKQKAKTVTFGVSFVNLDYSAQDVIGDFIRRHIEADAMTNDERRKQFRIEVEAPVKFRMIEEKTSKPLSDWMNGSTDDVSLGGVKVVAPMPETQAEMFVDRYALIEFSCQLPGTPKAIGGTASIAYFLSGETTQTATFGLSFVSIDYSAQDVIGDFIRQHIDSLEEP
jgi:c-di-GMP-binding flagellar brake protein YcgR